MTQSEYLLQLDNVKKWFPVDQGIIRNFLDRKNPKVLRAVDGVSFKIKRGEVFGLAGESGSGKTTVGKLAIHLLEPTEGNIIFNEINLSTLSKEEMRQLRSKMQVIFQDPFASLNPRMTIGQAISHPLEIHMKDLSENRRDVVIKVLEQVGLSPPDQFYEKYPHQISGGQRQRVAIARALVTFPEFVLADEPIAMADVSVRVLLLDLMRKLKDELHLTYLFITHDLATAKYICDRIGIMYLGKLVEEGDLTQVYSNPLHPYTQALLDAIPVPNPDFRRSNPLPRGEIPSPINPPSGCNFHPRCIYAESICTTDEPKMRELGNEHLAACHFAEKFLQEDSTANKL
ncbi:MAG: ATP-binding cassette domain-containing protein [Anaerolineales bacterium]